MAPKRTPSKPVPATPVRQGTRPSRYRTAVPLTPALSTVAASATSGNNQPPVSSTPTVTKPKPKAKTPTNSKATPAKPRPKPMPKKTPRSKRNLKSPSKKGSAIIDLAADNGDGGIDDVVSNASELSPTRSISPPPGWETQNPSAVKKRQREEDPEYEDEPTVKPKTKPVIGSKKKKAKKSVTWASDKNYKPEAESGEEEEAPLPSMTSRKRKSRPSEDQEYKAHPYDDDLEDDEMEDLPIDPDELDFINDLNPHGGASQLQSVHKHPSGAAHGPHVQELAGFPQRPSMSTSRGSNRKKPSKRQRTSSPSFRVPLVAAHTDSASDEGTDEDPVKAARKLFLTIEKTPRCLDLAEISALFLILQEDISVFCKRYFDFVLTPRQELAWPLHLLIKEYQGLFNVTRFISDKPACGWRNFFTKRAHRPHLVHGIIGEWIVQRIFKHTAFAVPDALLDKLEAVDREYLRYDAFVRSKRKATILEGPEAADFFFPVLSNGEEDSEDSENDDPAKRAKRYKNCVDLKARELAKELMQVLRPLLPPPAFDPLVPRDRQTFANREGGIYLENEIYFDLVGLIRKASSLHHCLLFAGGDGLVVQVVPDVQKGTMFTVDDADRNICVNADELNNDKQRPNDREGKLVVRMTCFGRVQAVMPHGPDLAEMEEAQQAAEAVDEELTREDAEQTLFPLLPYELQENNTGRNAVAELPPVPGTEWNTAFAKSTRKDDVKKHYQRGVRPGLEPEPEPIRHPFVTLYPRVAPSNLYCEWASSPESLELFSQSHVAQQQLNPQSLAEAVAEAQDLTPVKTEWFDLAKPFVMIFTAGGLAFGAYSMYRNYGTNLEAWRNLQRTADSACSLAYSSASSAVASVSAGASSYLSQLLAPTATASPTGTVVTPGTIGSIIYSALGSDYRPTESVRESVVALNHDSVGFALKSAPVFTNEPIEFTIQPAVDSTFDPDESTIQPAVDSTHDPLESELKSSSKANKSDSKSEKKRVSTVTLSTPPTITSTITEWTIITLKDLDPPIPPPPANTPSSATAASSSAPSTNMSALVSNLKASGILPSDATALPEAAFVVVKTNKKATPGDHPPVKGSGEQRTETTARRGVGRFRVL